jgi:putative tryptophan/tyrosine transport system substrate-binding protein
VKRREFITVLGGAAVAWPLVVRAQQASVPVIGVLSARSAADSAGSVAAVRSGLEETGYLEGRNITFEYRWADFHYDRLPALAADLVRLPPTVIVVMGGEPAALAAKAATQTIPIVFNSGGDPVGTGLVASLNRPGGNATGVSMFFLELGQKQMEMLQELVPKVAVIAQLVNPTLPPAFTEKEINDARAAGHVLGKEIYVVTASSEGEISAAFDDLVEHRAGALMVAPDPLFFARREQLVALTARHAIPAIYFLRDFADAGGLMSYGASLEGVYHQIGIYAGRILKGEKAADLPVVQPTNFELIINLKTAKALALNVPPTLLARADGVIE